jgi:hypothetical protein
MTAIALELTPELEQQLRSEAAKQGLDPSGYIVNLVAERLSSLSQESVALTETETALLQQINLGLSPQTWEVYHTLIAKRQAETLTTEEQTRLIEISDCLEQANASRLEALVKLARLRNTSLETLMQELGIHAPGYV